MNVYHITTSEPKELELTEEFHLYKILKKKENNFSDRKQISNSLGIGKGEGIDYKGM